MSCTGDGKGATVVDVVRHIPHENCGKLQHAPRPM